MGEDNRLFCNRRIRYETDTDIRMPCGCDGARFVDLRSRLRHSIDPLPPSVFGGLSPRLADRAGF